MCHSHFEMDFAQVRLRAGCLPPARAASHHHRFPARPDLPRPPTPSHHPQHVTFVSGANGSGKSAVLQALQCCLGVKAAQTGRSNSYKDFVRTGEEEAIVRVTLHNK